MPITITPARTDDRWLEECGVWRGLADGEKRSAVLSCPGCGERQTLTGHEIAADGSVSPSLACSFDCSFHDYVKLEGWTP